MELKQARDMQRGMEVEMMKMIRTFEEDTECVVTKAEMEEYPGTRFMTTTVFLGRELKKRDG